jgi:uncharacterized membrane protein
LTLAATLGCGLIAGVFFAFSVFVMKALSRLPTRGGVAAMQSINVTVLNPWFVGAFLGTSAICLILLVWSSLRWHEPNTVFLTLGSLLYLVGTLLVTIVFNVPKNEALATVTPDDSEAQSQWNSYVASWTAWNHVRTITSLAAACCFGIALATGSLG